MWNEECGMWNVECGMVAFGDEELRMRNSSLFIQQSSVARQFNIPHSTFNIQKSSVARQFNIPHSTFKN